MRCLRSRLRGGHRPAPSRAVRGCVERMHKVPLVRGRLPGARDQHAADRQERRTRLAGGKREVAGKRIRQTRTLRREERNTGTAGRASRPASRAEGGLARVLGMDHLLPGSGASSPSPPSPLQKMPPLPLSTREAEAGNLLTRFGANPPHRPTSWRKGPGTATTRRRIVDGSALRPAWRARSRTHI